jgi:hypothetical protein
VLKRIFSKDITKHNHNMDLKDIIKNNTMWVQEIKIPYCLTGHSMLLYKTPRNFHQVYAVWYI